MMNAKTKLAVINCLLSLLFATSVSALEVTVKDQNGKPIKDAVVYLAQDNSTVKAPTSPILVDQVDKEFIPYMTAIQAGTKINFPNNDKIRHQVYSFSEAKRFEIPLYTGTPSDPILFEKPGVIALGCNIHDWMSAYIFVANSPFFAVTDENGKATIEGLSGNNSAIEAWHPTVKGSASDTRQTVSDTNSSISFTLATKRMWRAWRAPNNVNSGGYR